MSLLWPPASPSLDELIFLFIHQEKWKDASYVIN